MSTLHIILPPSTPNKIGLTPLAKPWSCPILVIGNHRLATKPFRFLIINGVFITIKGASN